jgi:integrase
MASILLIGKRWRAQIRRQGQSITKTFRTKGAAETWARDQESQVEKGINAMDALNLLVGKMIAAYREARAEAGRPIQPKSNEQYMLARLESYFEDEIASQLSTQKIVKFAQSRKKAGAAPSTIDMDISKLGTVYRHMGSLLDVKMNNAPVLARPTLHHLHLIGPANKRERRPTPVEITKIFEWFAEHPERQQAIPDMIRVAMQCALRRGEIFRIGRDDVDHVNHMVFVRDRKDPRKKIGNDEWVPLIGDSYEVLMRQLQVDGDARFFPFSPQTASKYFKLACDAKGIVDLHLHDMRHEATSALFEAGWQIPEVATVTGHKDWRNLKRYTNLDPIAIAKKGRIKLSKVS